MTIKNLPRLMQAAKEFNISHDTLIDFLKGKKFDVQSLTISSKLSQEMYETLEKEFREDKKVKEKSEQISTKTNELNKIIESRRKKEIEEEKSEFLPTFVPEVKEVKVFDSIDISQLETKTRPKRKSLKKAESPTLPFDDPKIETPPSSQDVVAVAAKKDIEESAEDNVVRRAPDIKFEPLHVLNQIDIKGIEDKEQQVKDSRRKRIVTPVPAQKVEFTEDERKIKKYVPPTDKQDIKDRVWVTQHQSQSNKKAAFKNNKKQKLKDKKDRKEERQSKARQQRSLEDSILRVTELVSVADLASLMNISANQVIVKCMDLGLMVSINQRLDMEIIELIANEYNFKVQFITEQPVEEILEEEKDDPAHLVPRPPIVTIMGHVDHGKTSLLDFIRNANVVAGEAGGITQHIGAYEVTLPNSKKQITFLDTPGHEAFTAMRSRGTKVTDIVVIVVAADDSVMPQTKEAISHAQAANVPMIFAINKIDKPGANPEKVKEQLAAMNILVEDWGGKFQCEHISAKQGTNVDKLLEKILVEAELMDLKANPNKNARGTVLEASLEKGRGYVTNLLVSEGTLNQGDFVVAGPYFGRVKAMFNEREKKVKSASLSAPITVLGMNGAAQSGDMFMVFDSESQAKEVANNRMQILREQSMKTRKHITLDEIGRRLSVGGFKELNLIIKGDFDGSVEALADSLQKLSTEAVSVRVVHKAVGQISESDVLLAGASDSIIIGFQVRPSSKALEIAERDKIDIKIYSIIYQAIDDVRAAMEGLLSPIVKENVVGNVQIKEIFKINNQAIAGCYVKSGKILKSSLVKLIRDGIVIYSGTENNPATIETLRRFKDDVKEVTVGMECGIVLKNYQDIRQGDELEVYEIEHLKQKL